MRPGTAAAVCLLGTLAASSARAAEPRVVRGELGAKLDEYMTRLERLGYAGGLVLVKDGSTVLEKGYGAANRERNIPMTTDSVFNLGSITKQFTAAAILRLEMDGKLKVSDSLARFFKDVPADKGGLTLHHLLTHTAGLESDFAPSDYDPVGRDEYVRRALASKLLFAPGERHEYANSGYSLLAAVVEIVSAQPYEAYLYEHVLKPAGMLETGYKRPGWPAERVAHGYRAGQDWGTILARLEPPEAPYWTLRGNGGLHTTLGDMIRWHQALQADAVLSADARKRYVTPYVAEGPEGRSFYAYGWAVSKTPRGTTLVQHNGGNGIYVAEFQRFVDEGVMVFLTSTVAELKASPVVETVDRIAFGEPYALPPRAKPVAPGVLSSLAGRYRLPGGGQITISVSDQLLSVSPTGQDAYDLVTGGDAAPTLAGLTERTRQIVRAAFASDYGPLHEAYGGSPGLDEIRAHEQDLMEDRRSRLGDFKGFEVLGTARGPEAGAATDVRVDFEKASVYNRYFWLGNKLRSIEPTPQLPAQQQLVPQSETDFVGFSLRPAPTLRVSFTSSPARLIVRAPAGDVSAQRLP